MQFDSGTQSWGRFWFAARVTAVIAFAAALIVVITAPDQLFQVLFAVCVAFPLAFWLAPRFSERFKR
jgi:hypothetical protein